jgi:hypothetical protein
VWGKKEEWRKGKKREAKWKELDELIQLEGR